MGNQLVKIDGLLAVEKRKYSNMCTVDIKVDEAVLRDLMPELDSNAAIRLWVQKLVDFRIREMALEDEDTMSIEEAREMVLEAVREEYARP